MEQQRNRSDNMNAVQVGFFKEVLGEMDNSGSIGMGLKVLGDRHNGMGLEVWGYLYAGVYVPPKMMGQLLVKVISAIPDADLSTHDGINFKIEEYKEDDFTDIFLYNPDAKTDDWHQEDLKDFLATMRTKE